MGRTKVKTVEFRHRFKKALHDKHAALSVPSFSSLAAQLNTVASETELYAFVMQSYREFEQAVYRTAYLEGSDTGGLPGDNEASIRTARSSRVREASMAIVDTMVSRIKNHSCEFERLEDVADR